MPCSGFMVMEVTESDWLIVIISKNLTVFSMDGLENTRAFFPFSSFKLKDTKLLALASDIKKLSINKKLLKEFWDFIYLEEFEALCTILKIVE